MKKEGEEMLLEPEQSTLKPTKKTMEKHSVLLQPMEDHIRSNIHTTTCGAFNAGAGGYGLNKTVDDGET